MRLRPTALLTSLVLATSALTGIGLTTASPASAAAQVFSIPTPDAGLGRIVTAPNGDVWFVERDAQKIGRITPQGQVSEIDVSLESDSAQAMDLDVAPDGTLWVIIDSGEYAVHLRPDGSVISAAHIGAAPGAPGGGYPYGEQVRVAPNGAAWVTMSFDEQFATVVTDAGYQDVPNAPRCQGPLGEAADGSMWCSNNGSLFHLPGNAGIPVGVYASWPAAMTAGPVGDIWFANHQDGTFATSDSDGYVGYLSGLTPTRFDTGDRTAPNDLVRGPDGNMWFTSTGAAKGIGHVSAAGRGALTQVGGYEPESLTFGTDGAVWFTDERNNVVVRVPTSDLQVTNVDPGAGSVFTLGADASGKPAVSVRSGKKPLALRGSKITLPLTCATGTCTGSVQLTTAKKVKKGKKGKKYVAVTKPRSFSFAAGTKGKATVKLTGAGRRYVGRGTTTLRVVVGGVSIGKVKVRR